MSPTTRNTMMIGGGLIVAALLFTCGPLKNMFGGAESTAPAVPPPVAAAPPIDTSDADTLAAALAGATVGAESGASSLSGLEDQQPSSVPIAGVAAAAAGAAGAGTAAATTASAASPTPPPVSAGVPDTQVSAPIAPDPAALAAAAALGAAGAFDDAYAGDDSNSGGGRAADRFPPPVAASGDSAFALVAGEVFGTQAGGIRQPCDGATAGCQNFSPGNFAPGPNRPIVRGVRPVPQVP